MFEVRVVVPEWSLSVDETFETVVTCLRKVLARDVPIERDTDIIRGLGLDSLQMIEFLLTVEDELNIGLDFETMEMDYLESVDTFCRFVSGRR